MRIHHLALQVTDCERSLAFYAGVLGLTERARQQRAGALSAVWVAAGDTVIMLERQLRGRPGAAGSGHVLALAVDDLASWENRLASAGIAVDDRTAYTLYVCDPDGHRVGLSVYRF